MQQQCQQSEGYIAIMFVVTFRVGRRLREMYCGHTRLCVCLCVCVCVCVCPRPHAIHYCTDPDVTWGSGRGCTVGQICNRCTGCIAMATLEIRGRVQW